MKARGDPNLDHVHQQDALCVTLLAHFDAVESLSVPDGVLGRDVAILDHLGYSIQRLRACLFFSYKKALVSDG